MSNTDSNPPKLDPSSLYKEQEKRDELRLRTYNNILENVHTKIRTISRLPNNDKSLLFVVPEFVMGIPRFNTRDCIIYLAWNLRNNNFEVQYFHPNLLWISWRKHDIKYREEKNPIVKIMKNSIEPEKPVNEPILKTTKKTTYQYIPQRQDAGDNTKKVTFI